MISNFDLKTQLTKPPIQTVRQSD